MTILIINQDNISLNEVTNAFETQGYNVVATTNDLMAEKLFFQHNPSAVIFNASMPISRYTNHLKKSRAAFGKITSSSEDNYSTL